MRGGLCTSRQKKHDDYPTLIVELKCGKTAETALDQIKKMKYADVVENYGSDILLVGISYDKDDPEKKHHCLIEKIKVTDQPVF